MHDLDDLGPAEFVRPVWARWVTRVMLLICALLMMVVIGSQPKISRTFEHMSIWLSHDLSGSDEAFHVDAVLPNTQVPVTSTTPPAASAPAE